MSRAFAAVLGCGLVLQALPLAAQSAPPRIVTVSGAWMPGAPARPAPQRWIYGADVPPPDWREEIAYAPNGAWYVPVPQHMRVEPGHGAAPHIVRGQIDPRFRRQVVPFAGNHRPGTIVINTSERFLYLVQGGGTAIRYGVGVGRDGFSWRGEKTVTRKAEWPDWRPPEQMLRRRPDLPRFMPGGPSNPLGARALYLGSSLFRIHGSNEPETIGHAVSSGCFRMLNEDVVDLYNRVNVGTRVVVL